MTSCIAVVAGSRRSQGNFHVSDLLVAVQNILTQSCRDLNYVQL